MEQHLLMNETLVLNIQIRFIEKYTLESGRLLVNKAVS